MCHFISLHFNSTTAMENDKPFLLCFFLLSCCLVSKAIEVTYDNRALKIDGERKIFVSGSIHYPRSTPEMWPSLIQKSKDGGLDTIETYVFWNAHEPLYRQYDFTGNLDLVKYIKTIQDAGLYSILRIGPYVCAEWTFGGFPVWLSNLPNISFRTNNEVFKNEMKIFTTKIVDMMKKEKLFASQGGPIILAQIENEYGNIMWNYGEDGKKYVEWCANFAESLDIGVPWIMCQQDDAPAPMISTANGFYTHEWYPKNPNIPKIWTENWSGWYKDWGARQSHRTAEDLAFAVARFYQNSGTVMNYYMYHGGTNFGRYAGGPYITTSYDYDAPLDEYGNPNQPKWGHLKELHLVLKSVEKILTYGTRTNKDYDSLSSGTIYEYNGTKVCFIGNAHTNDITAKLEGNTFSVPAWSVTILRDCKTEVYNTARVNTQTSVMVKVPSSSSFNWSHRIEKPEHYKDPTRKLLSRGDEFLVDECVDQKVANGTSDYLWYMTSVDIKMDDPIWGEEAILHVHTFGPVLHAFVNGKLVGTQWSKGGKFEFVFEELIKLKQGKSNKISLLSVGVGLQNYGAFLERGRYGIHGPVSLVSPNNHEKNLTIYNWEMKTGLNGVEKRLYEDVPCEQQNWKSGDIPINREFVWYKTYFDTPRGEDPVVLDLVGMGKGVAWVNGHNIGRYWPSMFADKNGCSSPCDYRGKYTGGQCLTECGNSTQRWYHVPRSFLAGDDEKNNLVLLEELGGDPTAVSVQTITTGEACGHAYENHSIELSCQGGRVFSQVRFASFGNPDGECGSFTKGSCESPNSYSVVKNACLGKERCTIDVSEKTFGSSGCKDTNRLAVALGC